MTTRKSQTTSESVVAIIFLDVDGVLNDHTRHANNYTGTKPECVAAFNLILRAFPEACIVVHSSWRYLILNQYMTLTGFENMLLTHGVDCLGRVIGIVASDEDVPRRDHQILMWIRDHPMFRLNTKSGSMWSNGVPCVVLDDIALSIPSGHFVRPDPGIGLTHELAEQAIEKLQAQIGMEETAR